MAFKLDQSPSYRWPVTVKVIGENGDIEEHSFFIQFRRMKQSELTKLGEDSNSGAITDDQFMEHIILGWEGLIGEDGKDIQFSVPALLSLKDILTVDPVEHQAVTVSVAIIRAFYNSLRGGQEKNSVKPPEPGPMPTTAIN